MTVAMATGPKEPNGFSCRGVSSPAAQLRLAIQEARSWDDLASLCAWIDATYQSGGLDSAAAEELAGLTAEMARTVPEVKPDSQAVLAEELLDRDRERCACCGEAAWWRKGAQQVCGICHPNPHWEPRAEHSVGTPMPRNFEGEERDPFDRVARHAAIRAGSSTTPPIRRDPESEPPHLAGQVIQRSVLRKKNAA